MRRLVRSRFTELGFYVSPTLVDDLTSPEILIGDAADDLADITLELQEVIWIWEHASVEDALWMFHFTFASHWGLHLRGLPFFLHVQDPFGVPRWNGGSMSVPARRSTCRVPHRRVRP